MDPLRNISTSLRNALTWSPFATNTNNERQPQSIKLPDLINSVPEIGRTFRINKFTREASSASESWAKIYIGPSLRDDQSEPPNSDVELNTGLLAAICFPTVALAQLKLCSYFTTWVIMLEDYLSLSEKEVALDQINILITLVQNEPGSTEITDPCFARGLQNILRQLEGLPSSRDLYDRFQSSVENYLQLLLEIYENKNLEFYSALNRYTDAGWHQSLFILTEYSLSLDFNPNSGSDRTKLDAIREAASTVIVLALHIYAAAGHIVCPSRANLTKICGLLPLDINNLNQIQDTFDKAGETFVDYSRRFAKLMSDCGSSGTSTTTLTQDERLYANAAGDCVNGILHWPFESNRYFGQNASYVHMTSLLVPLNVPASYIPNQHGVNNTF